jgi:hypothetical protein
VSVVGSVAGGAESPADCSWTLVNPSSATDLVSLLSAESNIELNDMATPGSDWLAAACAVA